MAVPEYCFDQSSLEKALREALKSVLGKDGGGSGPRASFYNKFKEEVSEHDNDLQEKHSGDLDTTLIFSGLFSAVTSAFIIDIQSELKPDYEEMNNALLELLLNVTVGNIPHGQAISPPRWPGPDPAVRQVQATLYATLCATLFAAFLATLGKQWLNQYRQTDAHGSAEDRCRDRERKLSGIDRWWFNIIMQLAPLTIQGSLALLGSALSRYLWGVDRTVSSVVIGFTSGGFILYVTVVTASTCFPDCPFQTPLSALFCFIFDKAKLWLQDRQATPYITSFVKRSLAISTGPVRDLHQLARSLPPPLPREKGYKLDARCITRMLTISTDVDITRLTMAFVQEVAWDTVIESVPLGWIYQKLISCFDTTHPLTPILIPTLRDVAYLSAKAFAHIQVQQYHAHRPGEPGHMNGGQGTYPQSYTPLGPAVPSDDHDLKSVLLMVDRLFGSTARIPWSEYRLSQAHHLWMSRTFVYYASCDPPLGDLSAFVEYHLGDPNLSSNAAVITDCLCVIKTIPEATPRIGDYQSYQKDATVDGIFSRLSAGFQDPSPALERLLCALKLITLLNEPAVAAKSYKLFVTVMRSDVAQEKKMEAARLALHAAYQSEPKLIPPVEDHRHIFDFLRYPTTPYVVREPLKLEEFEWWYGVLWVHYGDLDSDVQSGLDEITNGTDRVDPERCKAAVKEEIGRVKELGGAINTATLEDAMAN